jgi:hypothetical protein
MRTEGLSRLAIDRWAPGPRLLVGLALAAGLTACHLVARETPQAKARPGDVLVRSGPWIVTLESPFREGEPNGLFDGVIRLEGGPEGNATLMEVNAICSLPGEPGWPNYDNLHGRPIRGVAEAKGRSGETQWQVLFKFSGGQDVSMGEKPGPWVDRLRENLCRRGSFDDRPKKPSPRREG